MWERKPKQVEWPSHSLGLTNNRAEAETQFPPRVSQRVPAWTRWPEMQPPCRREPEAQPQHLGDQISGFRRAGPAHSHRSASQSAPSRKLLLQLFCPYLQQGWSARSLSQLLIRTSSPPGDTAQPTEQQFPLGLPPRSPHRRHHKLKEETLKTEIWGESSPAGSGLEQKPQGNICSKKFFLFLHLVNSDSFLKTELKSQIQESNSQSKSVSLYKLTVFCTILLLKHTAL